MYIWNDILWRYEFCFVYLLVFTEFDPWLAKIVTPNIACVYKQSGMKVYFWLVEREYWDRHRKYWLRDTHGREIWLIFVSVFLREQIVTKDDGII